MDKIEAIIQHLDWNLVLGQLTYNPKAPLIFSTGLFLFLFVGFALVYNLLRNTQTLRILFVTLFSYYFYYKSSGFYFFLLAIVTCTDWLIARAIYDIQLDDQTGERKLHSHRALQRGYVFLSLLIDLGLLAYFKYTNFFCEFFIPLWGGHFEPLDIFLPVGISFFTFQSLSYTIDIYRGELKPLKNLLDYAFYVSFFPQLVAGPIVRARDFVPQIRKQLLVTNEMFGKGVFLIIAGLFKKAVISDYISVNFVERIFDNPSLYSGLENLLGVYGYTLQIYCDFSGYSDMAIGIALLLGFHFPQNFNSPYKSDSITDFWRRWHISLSSWLRDYLYISLGGNRKGEFRTYLNLVITMLLGGLWHGANWNFILWGALHGVAQAVYKFYSKLRGYGKNYHPTGLKRVFSVFVTFHFVAFCWIFFRNSTLENSWVMLEQMATNFNLALFPQLVDGYGAVLGLMLLGYVLHFLPDSWYMKCERGVIRLPLLLQALLVIAVIFLVIQVKSSDIQPFIYFQF